MARTTCCPSAESTAMRLSTTSRRVGGRPWASPPSTARTVSSAMNALPADAARPAPPGPTGPAPIPPRARRSTSRGSGASSSAVTFWWRRSSASATTRSGECAGRVVAEGGHHQHRFVGEDGDEVGDQVAGGPVGPVQVLDHQQHRAQLGELGDRLVQEVEQPHRRAVAAGRGQPFQPLRQQGSDVVVGPRPHRGAQRREDGPERRRVGDVDGAPGEHDGIGPPRLPHELADQLRLADTRVAADEDRARLAYAGRPESVRQRGQLARASP